MEDYLGYLLISLSTGQIIDDFLQITLLKNKLESELKKKSNKLSYLYDLLLHAAEISEHICIRPDEVEILFQVPFWIYFFDESYQKIAFQPGVI